MSDVVVVGSANADLVVEVPRRPGGGETLLGSDLALHPGGKGANQAAAAARAGARTRLVGCLGDDGHGAFLRERLQDAGVDVGGVWMVDRPTGTAIIFVTPDGENSIVVSPGANSAVDVDLVDAPDAGWTDAPVVVLSMEIPAATVDHVATSAPGRVVLNAAPARRLDPATLRVCDPLIVNEHEARIVLGLDADATDAGASGADAAGSAFEDLAQRLRDAGARSVVITLGADGALVSDASGAHHEPGRIVEVVDTTGAGDAFVGALACELSRGASLRDAARFAVAMSALTVRARGAQSSYPDRGVVERYLAG